MRVDRTVLRGWDGGGSSHSDDPGMIEAVSQYTATYLGSTYMQVCMVRSTGSERQVVARLWLDGGLTVAGDRVPAVDPLQGSGYIRADM